MTEHGRQRVIIEGVKPEIDGGRFPAKRAVGEKVVVEADIYADSHDVLSAVLLYRQQGDAKWTEVSMKFLGNDRWRSSFKVTELGYYHYTIQAWVDDFNSWQRSLAKKVEAGQNVEIDILAGAILVEEAGERASGLDEMSLKQWAEVLASPEKPEERIDVALSEELQSLMARYPSRKFAATFKRELTVLVDRKRSRFSSWYELFPRSCAPEPGKHGTFKDCMARLAYIAEMGFDVLYLPPIHPVGRTRRKGKNNNPLSGPADPGSPWAIGSSEGGHKAIHPELGSLKDFHELVKKCKEYGLELALDLAFQCTPDHPYAKEHPEWFRQRPDGSIQYAENPPKKYEDIYPLNFETDDWQELWRELKSVVYYWIEQGVYIFRVDNPHTKPFSFWAELLSEVRERHPEVIFLSEAFTRPKVMYQLAKLGFNQSYTYFAWRNTKWELTRYLTELSQTDVREFFRANLWPNTPDILTEYLQMGGRPAFMIRLVLAATLGANYGIYGPAFELCENRAVRMGSEEYLNSEKYEIRHWDIGRAESLKDTISVINRIRKENPALHHDHSLRFHRVDNEQLMCYSKHTEDFSNIIVVIVNLDPHHTHAGWIELPLEQFGLDAIRPYQAHDLLSQARFLWHGPRNYVELNPGVVPAHIFRLRRRIRTERDFDYFM
jgi:starch synthase (maltosyl-transferring)